MDLERIKDKNSTFPFLQMPRFIWEMEGLSLNAKVIYMLIYDRIRQGRKNENFTSKGGYLFCFYNDEELAKQLRMSKETVKRTIAELKKNGLLKREKKSFTQVITTLFVPCQSVTSDHFESVIHDPSKVSSVTVSKVSPVTPSYLYIYKEQNSNNKEQEEELNFASEKPKKQSKEKTKKKEKDAAEDKRAKEVTREIIEHWNAKYQTKYSPTTKVTVDLVKALLKNNYKPNQILQVIDYKAKSRKTEEDYRWFVPSTVLRLKNFERNRQFMGNEQKAKEGKTQASQSYKNRNRIPDSVTLPDWYEVKESEQASSDDVQKILELQNQILKGEQQ